MIPAVLGPLTVTSCSTRPDNGESYKRTTRTLQVVSPDEVDLRCPRGANADASCEVEGVDAQKPIVKVILWLDRWPRVTGALRVSGMRLPLPPLDELTFSLADLFPDRRADEGVQPGTYELNLAIGTYSTHRQFVAR